MRTILTNYLAYKLLLDCSYIFIISREFIGEGFPLSIDYKKYFEGIIVLLIILIAMPRKIRNASDILIELMTVFIIFPIISFYSLSGNDRVHFYSLIVVYLPLLVFRNSYYIKLPVVKLNFKSVEIGLIISLVLVTVYMMWYSPVFTFDLSSLYDYREYADESINIGIFSYITSWAYKVIGPTLIMLYVFNRKYFSAFIVFLLHILWFGLSTHKSVILYPALSFGIWLILKNSGKINLIPMLAIIPISLSMFTYYAFNDLWASSILIRRAFFVPASLSFSYLEYFDAAHFVYWSNSILSGLIDYPYNQQPAILIGEFTGSGAWANNSFISSGYMQAGVFGILIYGFLLSIFLFFINSISRNYIEPSKASSLVIVPFVIMYIGADLPTALLTHGLLLSIFLLWIIRSCILHNHGADSSTKGNTL